MASVDTQFKKGVHYSIDTEFKKGQIPYMKGRKHSPEANEKNRLAHLGRTAWNKGKTKETDPRIATPWKGKKRESMSGEKHPLFGKTHTDDTKDKIRQARVNQIIPSKETRIERSVEQELLNRGIEYQKQVPLCKYAVVDFYLPQAKKVIQCDGCYWHGCPLHSKTEKYKTDKESRQNAILTSSGYTVYRFWEHDINEDVAKCIDQIML